MQAKQPGEKPAEVRVEVIRDFQDHRRQILKKDSKATLPRLFAIEMQAANKVRILPEEPEPVRTPGPPPDKPKPGKREK